VRTIASLPSKQGADALHKISRKVSTPVLNQKKGGRNWDAQAAAA
jgi:hypothetical protein